jgi:hypothetical protein
MIESKELSGLMVGSAIMAQLGLVDWAGAPA